MSNSMEPVKAAEAMEALKGICPDFSREMVENLASNVLGKLEFEYRARLSEEMWGEFSQDAKDHRTYARNSCKDAEQICKELRPLRVSFIRNHNTPGIRLRFSHDDLHCAYEFGQNKWWRIA